MTIEYSDWEATDITVIIQNDNELIIFGENVSKEVKDRILSSWESFLTF